MKYEGECGAFSRLRLRTYLIKENSRRRRRRRQKQRSDGWWRQSVERTASSSKIRRSFPSKSPAEYTVCLRNQRCKINCKERKMKNASPEKESEIVLDLVLPLNLERKKWEIGNSPQSLIPFGGFISKSVFNFLFCFFLLLFNFFLSGLKSSYNNTLVLTRTLDLGRCSVSKELI